MIQSLSKPERIYVGSAVNFRPRWNRHKADLLKNKHNNPILQSHYNKYGKDDLVFDMVESGEYAGKQHLLAREQGWFDRFSFDGTGLPYFNISKIAGSNLGYVYPFGVKCPPSFRGRHHSVESKQLLREAGLGRKASEESIRKRVAFLFKPVYQYSLDGVFIKEWESVVGAGLALSLKAAGISVCARGICQQSSGFIWRYKSSIGVPRNLSMKEVGIDYFKTLEKAVSQFDSKGQCVNFWYSIAEASRKTGIDESSIGRCCKGKSNTAGGFIWKYKNIT